MMLGANGWLEAGEGGRIRKSCSPHFDDRPEGSTVDCIVVHNISLPEREYGGPHIEALFLGMLDPAAHQSFHDLAGLRVSSHFLIRRDAELVQFVSTAERAWHAGESSFQGRKRCNDFSIGVELEGSDADFFESGQLDALVELCRVLCHHHPSLQWIVGHSDIAPGRKTDPGPFFDWPAFLRRLSDSGIGLSNPYVGAYLRK